jgi:hypothetical protein
MHSFRGTGYADKSKMLFSLQETFYMAGFLLPDEIDICIVFLLLSFALAEKMTLNLASKTTSVYSGPIYP